MATAAQTRKGGAGASRNSAKQTVEVLPLQTATTFPGRDGPVNLNEPDGKPTDKQLWLLWRSGMLVIVPKGKGTEFSKGEASYALDQR